MLSRRCGSIFRLCVGIYQSVNDSRSLKQLYSAKADWKIFIFRQTAHFFVWCRGTMEVYRAHFKKSTFSKDDSYARKCRLSLYLLVLYRLSGTLSGIGFSNY